ncbi:antA/AntB antirepressor family protein [uncultured Clostridium sp.]|uniref:antA/AntB antirepressor family protein n=1 Tax=uncultured Clostridium sp. TaxID=59620 RepID=UPI0028E6DF93|nr:antA/AntB antirepressor family protein [uncultured Clostridium sp.]
MNNLTILTNELIPVYRNEKGHKLVNARELHEWLESGQDFSTWIKSRITQYGFVEGIDFTSFHNIVEREIGATKRIEYIITLAMAKELSMIERTEKGKQARQYFIKCEEKLKEVIADTSQLSPELQMFNSLFKALAKNELEQRRLTAAVQETKEEVQAIKDIIVLNPKAAWRRECNRILNAIGMKTGNYKLHKDEVYKALKERGSCRPNVLVNNLKKRAEANGMAPSKVEKLNILDVLENEPRLKEVYVAIVKDMAIKNGVRI